jgi:hypothetical protein
MMCIAEAVPDPRGVGATRRSVVRDRRRLSCRDGGVGPRRRTADAWCAEDEGPPAVGCDLLCGAEEYGGADNCDALEHDAARAVLTRDRLRCNFDRVGSRTSDLREADRMRCGRHQSTGRCTKACEPLTARL